MNKKIYPKMKEIFRKVVRGKNTSEKKTSEEGKLNKKNKKRTQLEDKSQRRIQYL